MILNHILQMKLRPVWRVNEAATRSYMSFISNQHFNLM